MGSSDAKGSADVKEKTNENTAQGATGTKSTQSTTERDRATTGQGAAAGSAKLSTEQRTKITTIIRQHKVESAQLNVSVRVGTRVPAPVGAARLQRWSNRPAFLWIAEDLWCCALADDEARNLRQFEPYRIKSAGRCTRARVLAGFEAWWPFLNLSAAHFAVEGLSRAA